MAQTPEQLKKLITALQGEGVSKSLLGYIGGFIKQGRPGGGAISFPEGLMGELEEAFREGLGKDDLENFIETARRSTKGASISDKAAAFAKTKSPDDLGDFIKQGPPKSPYDEDVAAPDTKADRIRRSRTTRGPEEIGELKERLGRSPKIKAKFKKLKLMRGLKGAGKGVAGLGAYMLLEHLFGFSEKSYAAGQATFGPEGTAGGPYDSDTMYKDMVTDMSMQEMQAAHDMRQRDPTLSDAFYGLLSGPPPRPMADAEIRIGGSGSPEPSQDLSYLRRILGAQA